MNGLEYKTLHASESISFGGDAFGIKIMVAASQLPNLDTDAIWGAAYKAAGLVTAEVRAAVMADDEEAQKRAKRERAELIDLFGGRIFVETIPNGYCSDWCCRHLPWFVVTTEIGRFKIGWRKRVIHLEWTDTVGTKRAEELFPGEDVTKGDKMIHAWSLDKARQYIAAIVSDAERSNASLSGAPLAARPLEATVVRQNDATEK